MSSVAAARPITPNRRRAVDRQPVNEQRRIRAEQARDFESSRKGAVKRAALKVGRFFKKMAKKVTTTTVRIVARVKASPMRALRAPLWFVVDNVSRAYLFARARWAEGVACGLFASALYIAPATTLVATVFVAGSYAIARVDSPFARFVSHVFFRAGIETFADGLAFAVVFRDRR